MECTGLGLLYAVFFFFFLRSSKSHPTKIVFPVLWYLLSKLLFVKIRNKREGDKLGLGKREEVNESNRKKGDSRKETEGMGVDGRKEAHWGGGLLLLLNSNQ